MFLVEFLANFMVFRVFLSISRDFADIPEFCGSTTARNFRSPVFGGKFHDVVNECGDIPNGTSISTILHSLRRNVVGFEIHKKKSKHCCSGEIYH